MRPALPCLAALLALLPLLAMPAQAQVPALPGGTTDVDVVMELQDPGEDLIPTRPYSLVLTVHYRYGSGAVVPVDDPGPPATGEHCGQVSVPVPPPWGQVRIIPPEVCFRINPQFVGGTTVDNTTIVEINVSTDAPALEDFNFTVRFDAAGFGSLVAAQGETARIIRPGYVGRVEVEAASPVVVRGGGQQQVPVTVRNLANGPIEVRFLNGTAPQGLRLGLPERVQLARNATEVVHLLVEAPWTTPVRGQVSFDVQTSHPARPDLVGETPRTRFDIEGRAAVPGMEPLLVLGALALAVVGSRARLR